MSKVFTLSVYCQDSASPARGAVARRGRGRGMTKFIRRFKEPVANMFIVLSIGSKNAALSGLIEISYPLFIALFSWLFFRENNLSVGAILGGTFVLIGVSLIYVSNK